MDNTKVSIDLNKKDASTFINEGRGIKPKRRSLLFGISTCKRCGMVINWVTYLHVESCGYESKDDFMENGLNFHSMKMNPKSNTNNESFTPYVQRHKAYN